MPPAPHRPRKCTPELQAKVLQLIRAGVSKRHAAATVGICKDTLRRQEEREPEFAEAMQRAFSEAVSAKVLTVAKAAQEGDWKAAAWWLERRVWEEYGRKDTYNHRHSGDRENPIEHKHGVVFYLPETDAPDPEEELLARVAADEGGDP